jgi:hypothetical protein
LLSKGQLSEQPKEAREDSSQQKSKLLVVAYELAVELVNLWMIEATMWHTRDQEKKEQRN